MRYGNNLVFQKSGSLFGVPMVRYGREGRVLGANKGTPKINARAVRNVVSLHTCPVN